MTWLASLLPTFLISSISTMAVSNNIAYVAFLQWVHASPDLWNASRDYAQQKLSWAGDESAQRAKKLIDYLTRRSTEPDPANPLPNNFREFENLSKIPYSSIYLLDVPPFSGRVPELVAEIKPYFESSRKLVDNLICNIAVVDAYRERQSFLSVIHASAS
jgi:hypothetical protein